MYDILIKSGSIIDGTGSDAYRADIGITGDKIAAIGDLKDSGANTTIDGTNLTVAPGFIDAHSHGDGTILMYPGAESALCQGITTFIGGTCGDSPAPRSNEFYMRHYWEYDSWYEIDNHTFYANPVQLSHKAIPILEKNYNITFDYLTFDDYLNKIEDTGISLNFIPLLGHNTIRINSMGPGAGSRAPFKIEMDVMKNYIHSAMNAGAWGLSTGLDYEPGAYASKDELTELVRELVHYDGIYTTHWRRTGIRKGIPGYHNKTDGIVEACEIGKATGVRVQLSHLMSGYDISPLPDAGLDAAAARSTLKIIDKYLREGHQVAFDVITNTSAGYDYIPYLVMYFTPWVRMSGGVEGFIRNLTSWDYREYFKSQIMEGKWYTLSPRINPAWDRMIFITSATDRSLIGLSLWDIASERGNADSLDTVIELLLRDPDIMVRSSNHTEGSIQEFLNHEAAMVCLDSYIYDDTGPFGNGMRIPEVLPHPNAYGGMISYMRRFGQPRPEDTIMKMTGVTARWLGLKRRGTIKEGNFADLVIFDQDNLRDNESYTKPRQKPEGIKYVLVNGCIVVDEGRHTHRRPGKVLRFNKKDRF